MYEREFRQLLKHSKTSTSLNIFLPKLDGIAYTFKDKYHKTEPRSNKKIWLTILDEQEEIFFDINLLSLIKHHLINGILNRFSLDVFWLTFFLHHLLTHFCLKKVIFICFIDSSFVWLEFDSLLVFVVFLSFDPWRISSQVGRRRSEYRSRIGLFG